MSNTQTSPHTHTHTHVSAPTKHKAGLGIMTFRDPALPFAGWLKFFFEILDSFRITYGDFTSPQLPPYLTPPTPPLMMRRRRRRRDWASRDPECWAMGAAMSHQAVLHHMVSICTGVRTMAPSGVGASTSSPLQLAVLCSLNDLGQMLMF